MGWECGWKWRIGDCGDLSFKLRFYSQNQRFYFRLSLCTDLHLPLQLPGVVWAVGGHTLPAFSLPGTFLAAHRLIGEVYILKK